MAREKTGASFSQATFGITGPHDGYIFYEAPAVTTGDGNLVLATGSNGTYNRIVLAAGGYESGNEQITITPAETGVRPGNVHIEINTPSTSPTTGALTVVGGVGISGDVNIAGNIVFGGTGTTLSTTTLTVSDPIVRVGSANASDSVDLGIVGEYTSGGVTKYTGVVRDATDGVVKFYKDTTVAPSNGVVNFSGAGLAYTDIKTGAINSGAITATGLSTTSLTATGTVSLSGTVDIQELRENVVPVTLSTNTATCDWSLGNIYYISTAPTGNMTFNFTNVPTDNDKVMTVNVMVTQGSTGYIPTTLQIAGTNQTIRWPLGISPTATSSAGKIDIFTFTLLRSGSAWIVFGNANLNY